MPTLLSVNNYFYRRDGSETLYIDHNRVFAESGWNIIPFSMQHPENPDSPWSRHFVADIEFGSDYSLAQKLARIPKVIYSLEAKRNLRRLLLEVRPDVAHCHSIYHHLSPSILGVLRRFRIPTVMTLHDLKIACPAYHMFDGQRVCEKCSHGRLHNVVTNRCIKGSLALSGIILAEAVVHRMLRSYARHVDLFISPCRFYIDKLVAWGWPREQFVHVPNFIDADSFTPEFNPGAEILYFGRLSAEKGVANLMRAAAMAGVRLRVVGDGPQSFNVRKLAADVGATVTFTGRLEGPALFDEIRRSRATVLPAEWYENAPMTILESFALGKPVIAANIGGIPELISHGETGWLYQMGSVEALADRLGSVAQMPESAIMSMGRRARSVVETEFSSELYRRRILDVYARVGGLGSMASAAEACG